MPEPPKITHVLIMISVIFWSWILINSLDFGPFEHAVGQPEAPDLHVLHMQQEEQDAGDCGKGVAIFVCIQQTHTVCL